MRPATPPVLWSEYDNPGSGLGNPLVLWNEYGNPGSGLGNPLVLWNEYGNPGSGLENPLVLWSEYDNPGSGLRNLQTVYNAISRLGVVCLVLPLSLARFHYLSLSNYKCTEKLFTCFLFIRLISIHFSFVLSGSCNSSKKIIEPVSNQSSNLLHGDSSFSLLPPSTTPPHLLHSPLESLLPVPLAMVGRAICSLVWG